MHNENPDCMFFNLWRIIVHPHGFAGAAGYVRDTRASRCWLLSNLWNNFQMTVAVRVQASTFFSRTANKNVKGDKGRKTEVKAARQREEERGRDEPQISAPECDCGPNGPA